MHNVNQKHHLHRNFLTGWPGFKLKEEGGGDYMVNWKDIRY